MRHAKPQWLQHIHTRYTHNYTQYGPGSTAMATSARANPGVCKPQIDNTPGKREVASPRFTTRTGDSTGIYTADSPRIHSGGSPTIHNGDSPGVAGIQCGFTPAVHRLCTRDSPGMHRGFIGYSTAGIPRGFRAGECTGDSHRRFTWSPAIHRGNSIRVVRTDM